MGKKLKNIIMFVIILAVIAVLYFVFFGGKEPVTQERGRGSGLESSTGTPVTGIIQDRPVSSIEASKIGQEFVNQLLNLQAIKLNDEIFSSLAFQSLEDFTIVLVQPGNEGRPNPFAPFGSDSADVDSSSLPGISETDITVTPVDTLPGEGNDWPMVQIGTAYASYNPGWRTEASYSGTQIIGYKFTLLDNSSFAWGGSQSACNSATSPAFQYGISTLACVQGMRASINGQNPTTATKNSFGDFVRENS